MKFEFDRKLFEGFKSRFDRYIFPVMALGTAGVIYDGLWLVRAVAFVISLISIWYFWNFVSLGGAGFKYRKMQEVLEID